MVFAFVFSLCWCITVSAGWLDNMNLKIVDSAYEVKHRIGGRPSIKDGDKLAFNTVQIFTYRDKVETPEAGTAFIIKNAEEPLLITCQHCVEGGKTFEVNFHCTTEREDFSILNVVLNNNSKDMIPWFFDEKLDLALLPLKDILRTAEEKVKVVPFFEALSTKPARFVGTPSILRSDALKDYGYLSDMVMIGYPYELHAKDGMPLARFGHSATDPNQVVGDRVDFYVDIACIGGSSGSPLWFVNKKFSVDGEDVIEKKEYKFAGMLFGGPESGQVPDIHLACVYNQQRILDFIDRWKRLSVEE